jgi:D-3-phosphoglycerate dehydrogenase
LALLRADSDVEVSVQRGLAPEALIQTIGDYHALVVRSETKVTAPVIEAGTNLRVIGRAGVGVDNIDVAAATRRGVVVCNSPEGNTIAATEHTLALLLAVSRNVPQADASLRAGRWERSKFVGVELYNKTLGVIGLGKIGAEVARRALALGMRVIANDPFVSGELAQRLGVEMVELPELLRSADYLTLHVPVTKETRYLLGRDEFVQMKDGVRIVNCARGGVIDEAALAEAVGAGKVAAAAVDVFEKEPPQGSPLVGLDNVITTPHLGASTQEAQIKVAVDVAQQVLEVLRGRPARHAVNVSPVPPEALAALEPFLSLAERMGKLHAQLWETYPTAVEVTCRGDMAEHDTSVLTRAFLMGLLQPVLEEPVTLVNAGLVAEARGLAVRESRSRTSEDYASLVTIGVSVGKETHSMSGTLFGTKELRIVRLDDYRVDFAPEGLMLFSMHYDRPGVIGKVGTILGASGVNIGAMHVGRAKPGGKALMILAVDSPLPEETRQRILQVDGIFSATVVEL